MESLNPKKSAAIALCVLLAGCGSRMERTIGSAVPIARPDAQLGAFLNATLTDSSNGNGLPLSEFRDRPLVVQFASDLCSSCNEEIREFIAALKDPAVAPDRVRIQTVLLASDAEYAEKWKRKRKMPWSVAVERGDALFRKSCPELQTPCLLVQMPGQGLVFQKVGVVPVSEIQKITGAWEE